MKRTKPADQGRTRGGEALTQEAPELEVDTAILSNICIPTEQLTTEIPTEKVVSMLVEAQLVVDSLNNFGDGSTHNT